MRDSFKEAVQLQRKMRDTANQDGLKAEDEYSMRVREAARISRVSISVALERVWQKLAVLRETDEEAQQPEQQKEEVEGGAEQKEETVHVALLDCSSQTQQHLLAETDLSLFLHAAMKHDKVKTVFLIIPFRCGRGEFPTRAQLQRIDAFILTASGTLCDSYVNVYNRRALRRLLLHAKDNVKPLIALGVGHIILSELLDGKVEQLSLPKEKRFVPKEKDEQEDQVWHWVPTISGDKLWRHSSDLCLCAEQI